MISLFRNVDHSIIFDREPRHVERIRDFAKSLPKWKLERLPPPRVNQSQVGVSDYV